MLQGEKKDIRISPKMQWYWNVALISYKRKYLVFQWFESCMLELQLMSKWLSSTGEYIATLFCFEKALLKVVWSSR